MTTNIVVKGYKIIRAIDQIGLRTIYSALHLKSGKDVFITVISVGPGRDLTALIKRARISRKLLLPTLVTAIDYGTLPNNLFFYTHESLPSLPIKRILEEIKDPTEYLYTTINFFMDALEIIAYIHDAQVTHRNINTAHLRISHSNTVHLEGFINARPKQESRNIANIVHLPYMSPEQLRGASADRKTDIYSMGVILHELVTGELPYPSNYTKTEDARNGAIPFPSKFMKDIHPSLENIIMKSLAPRKSRYNHARDWITDLEQFYNERSFKMKFKDFSSTIKNIFAFKS
ncbi:MAG: serine/threonine protein kinase [Chlamydiales bacterium]|jgi:serine/threonine protein kinase